MAQLPMQHSDNSSDSGPIIEASEVVKIYDTGRVKVNALHGVDLKVERGEDGGDNGPERVREDNSAQLPVGAGFYQRRRNQDLGDRTWRRCPITRRLATGPQRWATFSRPSTCCQC